MNAVKELRRVGEVAKQLGVSPRTIKYYEEIGLVEPAGHSQGGFRLYGERETERLERILRMKSIGYSLSAIRELLAVRDAVRDADKVTILRTSTEHLKEQKQEVAERIQQMHEELERAETLYEDLQRDIALCERRLEELGG